MSTLTPKQIVLLNATQITELIPAGAVPDALITTADGRSVLDVLYYTDYNIYHGDNAVIMSTELVIAKGVEFSLAGLDYITFCIGEPDFVPFTARIFWTNDDLEIGLEKIALSLKFSSQLLQPIAVDSNGRPVDSAGVLITIDSEGVHGDFVPLESDAARVSLTTQGNIYVDKDFDISLVGFDSLDLSPCKIPGLDMYLILNGLKLSLSATPIDEIQSLGFQNDFKGVYVEQAFFHFQDDLKFLPDIVAENFAIGTGGISGKITATFDLEYDPSIDPTDENKFVFNGDARGRLWGAHIGLKKFELELNANEVVSSEITGQLLLPFFDRPVEIELSLDLKGNISVGLKGVDGDILAELTKEDILSMKINSFSFSKQGKEIAFALGGSIKPLFGEGIEWPEFGVNNLIVWRDPDDLKWGVKLEGGWIDFPKALPFSVAGFKGELRKIGFGTIDIQGRKNEFVGFSGSVSFVSGFALAAEFDDLQLFYAPNIRVELERARIGLLIPNTISLVGEVSKKKDGFGGMIDVSILPMEMRILGGAEFGSTESFSYMQILMGLELPPPGIMLGTTPVAIRGFKGKYAMNMEPSMDPGWEWAIAPPRGIMPLSKMVPGKGGKMLGASLKITTTDGWLLGINALFALMLPGPVVMIEGRGSLFTKKVGGDPPFYALIVINGREQYFSANLSYNADLAKGVIKASGTVAAFFDFQNLNNWYVKLGQREPASKRITAIALKIFKATAYFEVYGGPRLAFGADISIQARKNFVVGHAKIKIYIGGGVDLCWDPEHAAGFLKFIAEIAIRVCGFGLGIGLFGEIDAKTPYPRHLKLEAGFHFFLSLPWPLPDLKVKGKLKKVWKDGRKYPCDFEPLVSEVLVDSEITSIPAKTLTHYDSEIPGILEKTLADLVPVVPMDARPTVKFAFPINDEIPLDDDASPVLAGNAANGLILHRIDEDEYKFSLEKLTLEKFQLPEDPTEFNDFLKDPFRPDDLPGDLQWQDVTIPYGVFIFDNSATGHSGATTLRLFSNTPFTHFRQTLFAGGIQQKYGLESESTSATWLNSSVDENNVFNEDAFIQQSESAMPNSATNLAATIEDQVPEYPLGQPTVEWRYVGFENVPLQFQKNDIKINATCRVCAAPDARGTTIPFDVIELHFLPPSENMPGIHNIPTLVRGVYFEGAVEIQFSFPISECELYLYPVKRESAGADQYPDKWPKEGKPENGKPDDIIFAGSCCEEAFALIKILIEVTEYDLFQTQLKKLSEFLKDCFNSAQICCEEALILLKKLDEIIKEKELQAYLKKLVALFENCCEDKKTCCEEAFADIKKLIKIVKENEAQTLLKKLAVLLHDCCEKAKDCCEKVLSQIEKLVEIVKEGEIQTLFEELVSLLNECCKQAPAQQLSDDEPFLSFAFAPTPGALHENPPQIMTRRFRDGESDTVPHDEIREVADNLFRIRMTDTGIPFDEVEVLNTLPGYGLFLVAIGYLPDVQEHWEIDNDKIEEVITKTWYGDGDEPVVLSPRSCYRLTVRTKACCDSGGPRDHIYYFRTDGPPGKNLKDYIAWTIPGFQKYPFFRNYDPVIRFGTNYVDQLFPDLPLRLNLKSESGRVIIAELDDGLTWLEEQTHLLRPEEKAYIDLLNASGDVDTIEPLQIPGDKSLIMTSAKDSIEADQGYTAVLDLSPESNFTLVEAQVLGVSSYFTQHLPMMMTAAPNPGTVTAGNQNLLGSSEDFGNVNLSTDTDGVLFQFKFRTSKFTDFRAMFKEIQLISVVNTTDLHTSLEAVAEKCQIVWRPIRLALWEKQLSVQRRLAKEEELLELMDSLADAGAQLDDVFSTALTHLPSLAGLLLQPLPKKTTVYWSPDFILIELPETVEFERISVNYDEFDVMVTCSSDESRLLIFPVSNTDTHKFSPSGRLSISYRLNIGHEHPRLRYGSLTMERPVRIGFSEQSIICQHKSNRISLSTRKFHRI